MHFILLHLSRMLILFTSRQLFCVLITHFTSCFSKFSGHINCKDLCVLATSHQDVGLTAMHVTHALVYMYRDSHDEQA